MRKLSLILASLLLLLSYSTIYATSGCCSGKHNGVNCSAGPQANGHLICADGWRGSSCMYADNCSGSYVAPAPTTRPSTPRPITATTRPSTPKPTVIPTNSPTSTPIETPTSSPVPEVKGIETTPSPTPKPLTAGETVTSFGVIILFFWGVFKLLKKLFKR